MFKAVVFRKVRGVVLGAVGLALALSGATSVFAQGETPPAAPPEPGVRWGGGEVTAVGPDSFDVHTRSGRNETFIVDANTVFFNAAGRPASFVDLKVGMRVAGSAELRDDGTRHALLVILFPPQTRYQGAGVVTALEGDAFHFVNRRGRVWEFYVDDATQFTNRAGDVLSFADLAVETRAFVQAELRDDGKWWAVVVRVGR